MKKKSLTESMNEAMSRPVPFETFSFALALFHHAARGDMPGYHLQGGHGPGDSRGGMYLTNIPMNRGMMAVVRENQHLTDEVRQSLLMRLMHFGEVMGLAQSDPRFAEHFKPADEEGAVMVSDAFTRAVGECIFVVSNDHIGPDMEDLLRLANQYRDGE